MRSGFIGGESPISDCPRSMISAAVPQEIELVRGLAFPEQVLACLEPHVPCAAAHEVAEGALTRCNPVSEQCGRQMLLFFDAC
jgi:hypothetical protein